MVVGLGVRIYGEREYDIGCEGGGGGDVVSFCH